MEGGELLPARPSVPEAGRGIERQYKREEILSAFHNGFAAFESYPAEKLSPRQQESRDLTREIKGKTLDQNKLSYLNIIPNGKGQAYRQKEYLPVEELKIFLNQRIESGELSPEEAVQYQKWSEALGTAQPYDRTKEKREPHRWTARARQEIERIKRYPDLIKLIEQEGAEKGKSLEESLLNEAERRLLERRELIVSGEEKIPVKHEEYDIDVISAQEAIDKKAHDQATKDVTAQIRNGRFYEFWHWPRKIGMRLIESGAVNIQTDRLRQSHIRNNTSFCDTDLATAAAKGTNEQRQILDRFKQDRILSREQRIEASGPLKQAVVNELLRPITDGTITSADQVRALLTTFVHNHLNDADPAVRAQIESLFGPRASDFGNVAEYFATDILETGLHIRTGLQKHKESLEQFDQYIHIYLGLAREAYNTDVRSITDRTVAWARQRQNESLARGVRSVGFSGVILNPAVVGVAVALGAQGILRSVGWTAKAAAIPSFIAGGIGGAAIAGARRYVELGKDRQTLLAEKTMGETLQQQHATTRLGKLFERITGGYRRNDLENFRYDHVSVKQLLEGDGAGPGRELVGGQARKSITELTSLDLSDQANRDEIARRISEIELRLNRGQKERIDWIQYTNRDNINQEVSQLLDARDQLRNALRGAGLDNVALNTLESTWATAWNQALSQDHHDKDIGFRNYRLRNAAGAAVFGGAVGLTGGLLSQEAVALGKRALGETVGKTVLEEWFSGKTPAVEAAVGVRASGFAVDQTKDLFEHPRNLQIDPETVLRTFRNEDGSVSADFVDSATKKLSNQPIHLIENGGFVISGSPDDLPDKIKQFISSSGWQSKPYDNPDFNLQQKIQGLVETKGKGIFTHGNTIISIDAEQGTASLFDAPTKNELYGTIGPDGSLVFKSGTGEISNINVNWQEMQSRLGSEGWNMSKETITPPALPKPPVGNVLDQLLGQNPDVLRAKGIMETDQFKKSWNFHVLRPDIVSATGQHTHNELTLHVGGEYQVGILKDGQVIPGEIRHGVGAPGTLNTGSELNGGLIQSHLMGVSSQEDPVLNDLIKRAGGLKMSDTVFVVDLTNGKQIMLPTDIMGNGKLPDGLFDPQTGSLRGVETIATAVIQKPDGSVLSPTEVFQTGQIPNGSIVHSLASERFLPVEPPKVEIPVVNHSAYDVYKFTPPTAVEFDPPPLTILPPPVEVEPPPLIPIPFSFRHPLPLERLLFLYGYGGSYSEGGLGWLGKDEWEQRRSQTLKENPNAKLDESKEVADYLSKLDQKYHDELEQMDLAMGVPMSSETRAVVTIPAFGEGKIIRRTLEQFLNQRDRNGNPINPNLFEIIVYENDTELKPKDETESEVHKFKRDHPEFNVHYAYKRWSQVDIDNKVNTIGNGRRYSCDLAILRNSKRTTHPGELIIINNDADLEGITSKYIADVIAEFDSKDYLDSIVGKRNLPEWALKKPNVRAGQRMWEIFDAVMRQGAGKGISPDKRERGWPGMIGENSAMRASIYAAVGGYNPQAKLAEDQELGYMMRISRNYDDRRFEYLNRLQTIKNPRRYLTYMVSRRPLIEMYNDYHENKEIRELNNRQLLSYIPDAFDITRFELDADGIYQKKADFKYYKNNEFDLIFQRMMGLIGVEYVIENGHVKITNAQKLIETVSIATPPVAPTTPKTAAAAPQGLLEQLNRELEANATPEVSFTTSPQAVVNYLKTIKLPFGASIKEAIPQIINNQLNIAGTVDTMVGSVKFNATLSADPRGILRITDHQLNLPLIARTKRGDIEKQIKNLNQIITEQINKQIDPAWQVSGFRIAGNQLAFDFKKK